ncbi:hypothetical protein GCM10011607_39700 [Shewanella inventionis]|uniref:Uncharacterized protein n=2 Tax=Shewanella inventionis TaxID=1738770 RepID=A0ABQ1JV58_9GAMM|nr:hypothetical protein GCM10011607_39700 [Shewanella inventionis]
MPIGGIDVSDELFAGVMIFIKALFKRLKVQQFDIEITHWGEIFLVEPSRGMFIQLSVHLRVSDVDVKRVKLDLKSDNYRVYQDECFAHESLCVSLRVNRSGTQWRRFPLDVTSVSFDNVMATIIKAMHLNVANLTPTVKHELSRDIHTIDVDDVVALIRYGAAKLGPDSQFASIISGDRDFLYVKGFTFDGTQLRFSSFNLRQYQYCLSPQSMKIIKMLIPDAGGTIVEFVS